MHALLLLLSLTVPLWTQLPSYWNEGLAEIAIYKLEKERYGEIHPGELILVSVSEPFRRKEQVKAEKGSQIDDLVVLKVIQIRRFTTGIYDYSLMSSTFYDVTNHQLIKASFSAQDWCGQEYWQMNLWGKNYQLEWHSYFEQWSDGKTRLPFSFSEDEILARLRINPDFLPVGELELIPSLQSFRLERHETKTQKAVALREALGDKKMKYEINYPSGRMISIIYDVDFPHIIREIRERHKPLEKEKTLTSRAILTKTERIAYWKHNRRHDESLRKRLGLKPP
ncbi:MAG: hypothetical protein NZM25_03035 [Leptospiraceae bacterium]|nr:hypothetical protein [Leptospiraceae bacterium]